MTETNFEPSEFELKLRKALLTPRSLNLPDDIPEIVHKFFPWKTTHDVENSECFYSRLKWNPLDPKTDIHSELSKLEDFSAILERLRDSCLQVYVADSKRLAQPFRALVEKVPSIKDDPSYEYLTTDFEKINIEKALEVLRREQNQVTLCSQIQVTQQSLSSHLEVLRRELQKIDNDKIVEASQRLSLVTSLRNRVKRMTETLEFAVNGLEFSKMMKDSESIRESNMTRFQQVGYNKSEGITNKFPGFSRL